MKTILITAALLIASTAMAGEVRWPPEPIIPTWDASGLHHDYFVDTDGTMEMIHWSSHSDGFDPGYATWVFDVGPGEIIRFDYDVRGEQGINIDVAGAPHDIQWIGHSFAHDGFWTYEGLSGPQEWTATVSTREWVRAKFRVQRFYPVPEPSALVGILIGAVAGVLIIWLTNGFRRKPKVAATDLIVSKDPKWFLAAAKKFSHHLCPSCGGPLLHVSTLPSINWKELNKTSKCTNCKDLIVTKFCICDMEVVKHDMQRK